MSQQIKILIACDRQYPVSPEPCYLPVEVGVVLHTKPIPGFTPDNAGENISGKNRNYCELTALYWAWKNLDADYIGLVHYRRYFAYGFPRKIAGNAVYEAALERASVILPKPRHYRIETNYSQYAHAHHAIDLDTTREILQERHPECVKAFDSSMKRSVGHRFNMLVMSREKLDAYCTWLFDILFALEKRLDISTYNSYDARVFGFVAERLLDVWIEATGCPYYELPYLFTEKQNWLKKGCSFLKRKFLRRAGIGHEKE